MIDPLEMLDALPDLVCYFDRDGILHYVNAAYADYYRSSRENLVGRSFLTLVPEAIRSVAADNLARLGELRVDDPNRIDVHQGGDSAGRLRWFEWTNRARFAEGIEEPVGFITVGRDITDQRKAQERSEFLATHDSLTGLKNRWALRKRLEEHLEASSRDNRGFGLIYLDIDRLKWVNDNHGHAAGDAVLRQTANSLLLSFRSTDIVARVGGDEFVVLCPGVDDRAVLDQLVERARCHLSVNAGPVASESGIGISGGLVVCGPGMGADEVLNQADTAMYENKQIRRQAAALLEQEQA